MIADNGSVDRLPSFITGPQPQINGGPGGFEGNGGERFPAPPPPAARPAPRRRAPRRCTPGDDFNPGNE